MHQVAGVNLMLLQYNMAILPVAWRERGQPGFMVFYSVCASLALSW
jgi:hypothetical protein